MIKLRFEAFHLLDGYTKAVASEIVTVDSWAEAGEFTALVYKTFFEKFGSTAKIEVTCEN